MKVTYPETMDGITYSESGYSDHPADPGSNNEGRYSGSFQ